MTEMSPMERDSAVLGAKCSGERVPSHQVPSIILEPTEENLCGVFSSYDKLCLPTINGTLYNQLLCPWKNF